MRFKYWSRTASTELRSWKALETEAWDKYTFCAKYEHLIKENCKWCKTPPTFPCVQPRERLFGHPNPFHLYHCGGFEPASAAYPCLRWEPHLLCSPSFQMQHHWRTAGGWGKTIIRAQAYLGDYVQNPFCKSKTVPEEYFFLAVIYLNRSWRNMAWGNK